MFTSIFLAATNSTNNGISGAPGIDLTIQNIWDILNSLVCWATRFILVIMVLLLVWYGLQMMLAQGNPTKFGDAKKSLMHAIIGMVVIIGAYTIIATIHNAVYALGQGDIGAKSAQYSNFLPISCP